MSIAQSDPAAGERHLDQIEQLGLGWVRSVGFWTEIEPLPPVAGVHTYNWLPLDAWVTKLASHGLRLLPMPSAPPLWARSLEATTAGCGTRGGLAPGRVNDYGAMVGAMVDRYGEGGSFWAQRPNLPYRPIKTVEVWNEPNWTGSWCPGPQPETYARALSAAAQAAHAADSSVRVTLGGLVMIKQDEYIGSALRGMETGRFLRRLTEIVPQLPQQLDAVAVHFYEPDPDVNLSLLGWVRARMRDAGFEDQELLLSEFGWHTDGGEGSITEAERAQRFAALLDQLPRTDCDLVGLAPHAWVTPEADHGDPEDWFGIARSDTGALYATGQAFAESVAVYRGQGTQPAYRDTIGLCGGDPPDQDGDTVPDSADDYPLDPSRSTGSGEVPPTPPSDPAPPEEPRKRAAFYGVSTPVLPPEAEVRRAYYDQMKSARIGSVRETVPWGQIQTQAPADPNAGLRWGDMDSRALLMARRGIELRPTFDRRPSWLPASAAAANSAYATFMASFARGYGRGGSFWDENRNLDQALAPRAYEIWSQANNDESAWDGSASAAEYAALFDAARTGLRTVDAGARAIVSLDEFGEAGNADQFIRGMVSARPSLAGRIDGVHVLTLNPSGSAAVENLIARIRTALNQTGNPGASITVGVGWFTSGAGSITESERATRLASVTDRLSRSNCGVEALFPHAWVMAPSTPASPWDSLGIASFADGSLKPTGVAYRNAAAPYLGWGQAPRDTVHGCGSGDPDADADGVADPLDDFPLDPDRSDGAPPELAIIGPSGGRRVGRRASFELDVSDASEIGAIACRFDSDPWQTCASSYRTARLKRGEHVLRLDAIDEHGNRGTVSKRWRVRR
jgi:hypothetical protein